MKKFYLLTLSCLLFLGLNAQVNITFQVDVTDYVAGGATIAANGLRVGGAFGTLGGEANGVAMMDWNPTDAGSAMTDMGNNIWSITVTYPASSIGETQSFKYVNGDWGMNEGTDVTTIADDGCGEDDGAGNINRMYTIPEADATFQYCWDACTACDGTSSVTDLAAIDDFTVAPNPTSDLATFTYTLNKQSDVTISVFNMLGKQVAVVFNGEAGTGSHSVEADLADLSSGLYLYQIQVGDSVAGGQLIKQ